MMASTKIARKNIEDIIALTPMQEGMLFHYLEAPQRDYYFEQLDLAVSGEIDIEIFEKAWNFVIDTNEMLRTLFRWEDVEQPVQIILKEHKIQPGYFDFSGKEPGEKQKKLEELIINDRGKNFLLEEVPARITLCKLEKDKYRMIVSNHHILYDGWSNGIILKEFIKAYKDLSGGKIPVKPVKTRFKEFIQWYGNQDIEKQEKYWRGYLEGFDHCTQLPVKGKKAAQVNNNKTYRWKWGRGKTDELMDFLKKNQLTLASLLYGSWGILLQKYNNSDDVVFGTTVSGRNAKLAGIDDMVGLFINTLPLRTRTRVKPREKAEDVLHRMEKELQLRQDYEHSALVNIRKWSGIGKGQELFDSIVILENYPLENRLMKENRPLSIDKFEIFESTHYDLTVTVTTFAEIEVKVIYHGDLFDDESIERLIAHFAGIVEKIMVNPGGLTAEIEIISKEEKNKILYDFNDTAADYPREKTIHRLFEEQAERAPGHTALVCPEQGRVQEWNYISITYRELDKKSGQLAYTLKQKGVGAGIIVGIKVERSLEMLIGILGILKAGGAYLPIDPRYPGGRINYMLKDSGAYILLTALEIAGFHLRPSPSPAAPLAYIIYTSGSTGIPKGVMIEHSSAVNILAAMQKEFPLEAPDAYLLKTSYVFDVSVTELFGWFFGGGRLVVLEKDGEKNPGKIMDTVERNGITHMNFVPSMFHSFTGELTPGNVSKLSPLKYIFLAGETLLPGVVNKFRRLNTSIVLENIYGPTEGTVYSSKYSLSGWDGSASIPIGKPMQNIKLLILDKDYHLQPMGIPGELVICGPGLARGYLNDPGLTAERFVSSPFTLHPSPIYKTGDLARWLPDGNIEFLGRIDHQVKIRGFRIELGEIENRLLTHKKIKEAIVIAGEDKNDKYLCAYLVAKPGETKPIDQAGLREYLANRLPGYMVPSYFVQLDNIPLTPSGKIDRKVLPLPGIQVDESFTPPGDETQKRLVEIWSDLTGIEKEKISIDANFSRLGGHSLNAIMMASKIHKEFNINIPVTKIFKAPTIRGIADLIAAFDWVYDDHVDGRQKREEILL